MKASKPRIVGVVTTSFPLSSDSTSGVFVKRLVSNLPTHIKSLVIVPAGTNNNTEADLPNYELIPFSYGPRALQRLTHSPGGIPAAIDKCDPAILLLPLLIISMFFSCWKLAKHVDLIHSNWSGPGLIGAIAARLRGKPAITTLRGQDVNRAEHSFIFRLLLKLCILTNTRCITVSQSMQNSLRERFPKQAPKIGFIPNGVEIICSSSRTNFHTPARIITVSNLTKNKNIETLIHAIATPNLRTATITRIVGNGPELDALKYLAQQLGVADRIEFLGSIPPGEVTTHLLWADIFVFTSLAEGRPNAILEAMSASLPIVAADIPGVNELLASTNAGLLFPITDHHQLNAALQQLLDSPSTALNLGDRAREAIAKQNLSWSSTGIQYSKLYETILNA